MIRTSGLVKRFGTVVALDGLDLAVPRGTVLGLLGPNGAGKTTAVRILTTLLEPDEGMAEVAGIDVRAEPGRVRERIGLSGQAAAVDEHLTGYENLEMVGRLYHLGRARSQARARELLERFDLVEAAGRPAKGYSGGMRRRLDLAAALVANPDVVFLDEPTTGLDPRSRLQMWDTIAELVAGGSTVLLTTQHMEEADRLADDIVVIDRGRKIAQGSPHDLKARIGGACVEVVVASPAELVAAQAIVAEVAAGELHVDAGAGRVAASVGAGVEALERVVRQLRARGVAVLDVGLRHPTLDDVFLALTGHGAEEGPRAAGEPAAAGAGAGVAGQREAVR